MRWPLTRARICAVMYPTSVPTYSTDIGTSFSITGSTLTTGVGGGAAAREASPQPAAAAAVRPIKTRANTDRPGKRIVTDPPGQGLRQTLEGDSPWKRFAAATMRTLKS